MRKNILIIIVMLCLAITADAQFEASSYATVSANIISPVGTSKTSELDFGQFRSTDRAGEIIVTPFSNRFANNSIKLSNNQPAEAASFLIHGINNAYSLELPEECMIVRREGNEVMKVCYFDIYTERERYSNMETILIGATLHVQPKQKAGNYIPAQPFDIIIHYN